MGSMVDLVNSITFDAELLPGSVTATVTPVGGSAIVTSGVWMDPAIIEVPEGVPFGRAEEVKLLAVTLADVPSAPRLSVVVAPEVAGGSDKTWRVESGFRSVGSRSRVLLLLET